MQPKGLRLLHAFFLSLGQLFDRPVLSVLLKSLAVTLLLFAATGVGLWFALDGLVHTFAARWQDGGIFATVATLALLFRAIAVAVIGVFGDEVVAARHLPARQLSAWRKETTARRFGLGLIGTGLFVVPVLNLAAPVLGAAMAAHLFHRGQRA